MEPKRKIIKLIIYIGGKNFSENGGYMNKLLSVRAKFLKA